MTRLRWVHLGYQFDYNVVDYKPEHYFGFPKDLSGLMNHVAGAIGYSGYTPEAGIVNYYPLGTSMGGHTDHYELDLSWPLISISFGQSAVFLIGGKTKDIKPTGNELFISHDSITSICSYTYIYYIHIYQFAYCKCKFCCKERNKTLYVYKYIYVFIRYFLFRL